MQDIQELLPIVNVTITPGIWLTDAISFDSEGAVDKVDLTKMSNWSEKIPIRRHFKQVSDSDFRMGCERSSKEWSKIKNIRMIWYNMII